MTAATALDTGEEPFALATSGVPVTGEAYRVTAKTAARVFGIAQRAACCHSHRHCSRHRDHAHGNHPPDAFAG